MSESQVLETARLRLRPYTPEDVSELVPLIGAREIAATTLRIPHPYTESDAREFVLSLSLETGAEIRRAITLRSNGRVIGGVGLVVDRNHSHAELGYWIGVPFWGNGYGTEAAQEMVRYGFEQLGLKRIFAVHFAQNHASGRILQKLGMKHEGTQRQHVCKWGQFIDSELYGILREEWRAGEYNG